MTTDTPPTEASTTPDRTPTPTGTPTGTPTRTQRLIATLHRRPRRSLLAVLLFVLLAGVVGGPVAGALTTGDGFAPESSESVRAVERIERATGVEPSAGIVLLVETPAGSDDPAVDPVDPVVTAAADRLADVPGIASVTPVAAAPDGSSALVAGTLTAEVDDNEVAEAVLAEFADDAAVDVGGAAVAFSQIGTQISEDLARSELLAFPVLLLLSLLIFGGRAAVIPLAVGVTTILTTFLVMTGVNQFYGLNLFALNLVIGLGLGLAIDYTLFLLTRYREELERQGPTLGAVLTTMRTAGRTVVFSAATVAVALATLTVFPLGFLQSMGTTGAIVAVVAALASLVLSPAMFGLWGARLARRRRGPGTAEAGVEGGAESRWYRLSHAVMRRPGLIAAATAAVMVVLAAPALQTQWTPVDETVVPAGASARVVDETIDSAYGGTGTTPVTVAISGDPAEADAFAAEASGLPGVLAPGEARELAGGTWQLDLEVAGDPAGDAARTLVADVRDLADRTGTDALVAGPAAAFLDQQAAIADGLPLAGALLVLLTMLVLWLMTGSVVLPLKAVVMNTLTVGVALGAIAWVYQDGRLTGLLGYEPNGGIEPTAFLVTAALVFALSTDYGVFLLGRIREARESGIPEREAVAVGLSRTGSVVTAAAILLAVAIGAFSLSEISFIQQIGIATAVGVLIDAFVVRSLLVPALMGLLGKWNWWAPMWLRRVHDRIGLAEGEPGTVAAAVPAVAAGAQAQEARESRDGESRHAAAV